MAELRRTVERLERDLVAERERSNRLLAVVERAQLTDQRERPTSTPRARSPRRSPPAPAPAAGVQPVLDALTTWWRGR